MGRKPDVIGEPSKTKGYFVYVIASRRGKDIRTYVGWTTDVERRLRQHNVGTGAKSTRGRQWILLYSESYKTRNEAMSREWHIKLDREFRATLRATFPSDCQSDQKAHFEN